MPLTQELYFQRALELSPPHLAYEAQQGKIAPLLRKPANRMVEVLKQSGILVVTDNNEHDLPPGDRRFLGQVTQEVYSAVNQSIDPELVDTTQAKPKITLTPEIQRITQHAEHILSSFLDAEVIQAIMPETIGNLVYLSCQIAKHPEIAQFIDITTGFGGSDDESSTPRVAAYAIPALKLWQNLNEILAAIEEPDQSIIRPRLRFFWAAHAAVQLNGMDPEHVLKNVVTQQQLVQKLLSQHPEAATRAYYQTDLAWGQHTPATTRAIYYLTTLAADPQSKRSESAMANLYTRGSNHNGSNGNGSHRSQTQMYTAIHPGLFGDRSAIQPQLFSDTLPVIGNITIGSRAERQFNIMRADITNRASKAGFKFFINGEWLEGYDQVVQDNPTPHADTMLIGTVGEHSVPYYPQPYESPDASAAPAIITQLEAIANKIGSGEYLTQEEEVFLGIANQLLSSDHPEVSPAIARLMAIIEQRIQSVLYDYGLLITFVGGPEKFIELFTK
ncbi:MAG: hypothetical protein HY381_00840 [Candidatus Chisholmbacteria bacterium]|nr:hypothetical protein [Candidatus Chisholmbacteria bacterium]